MNSNIPIAVMTASISAIALVAAHQKLNTEQYDLNDELVDLLVNKITNEYKHSGNTSILNKELALALASENGDLLGVNINEVLASSDWSSKYNPSGYFEQAHSNGGENAATCYNNCYNNCHTNCHGSRSWR